MKCVNCGRSIRLGRYWTHGDGVGIVRCGFVNVARYQPDQPHKSGLTATPTESPTMPDADIQTLTLKIPGGPVAAEELLDELPGKQWIVATLPETDVYQVATQNVCHLQAAFVRQPNIGKIIPPLTKPQHARLQRRITAGAR